MSQTSRSRFATSSRLNISIASPILAALRRIEDDTAALRGHETVNYLV